MHVGKVGHRHRPSRKSQVARAAPPRAHPQHADRKVSNSLPPRPATVLALALRTKHVLGA
jgi:hypothetical protein